MVIELATTSIVHSNSSFEYFFRVTTRKKYLNELSMNHKVGQQFKKKQIVLLTEQCERR